MGDPFVRPGLSYAPEIEAVLLGHHGTMGPMTSVHDWITSQHRDTIGSLLLNDDQLQLQCVVENVCPQRMRRTLLERLVDPTKRAPATPTVVSSQVASVSTSSGSGSFLPPTGLPHRPVFVAPPAAAAPH